MARIRNEGFCGCCKAAEGGYGQAQHNLGTVYYEGIGVRKNYPEAVQWFAKAAKQELGMAAIQSGDGLLSWRGRQKNPQKAVSWLKKAAKQNLLIAQASLGYIYVHGQEFQK